VIVCLAANPSIDKLFEIDRLVKGDIHRPQGFVQAAGGKGLNVARAALPDGCGLTPKVHAFFSDRAPWVEVHDALPKRGGVTGTEPIP